jgi:hypothetical protein
MGNFIKNSSFIQSLLNCFLNDEKNGKKVDEENYTTTSNEVSQSERKLIKKINNNNIQSK